MLQRCFLLGLFAVQSISQEHGGDEFKNWPERPGAWVQQTRGEVWPKPKLQKQQSDFFLLRSSVFRFEIGSSHIHGPCDIIDSAISRYYKRVFPPSATDIVSYLDSSNKRKRRRDARREVRTDPSYRGYLDSVEILMNNKAGCEKLPHLDMDEHYEVKINSPDDPGKAKIIAFTVWGILRGLETFSQLVYPSMEYGDTVQYLVNGSQVMDSPRFSHRGVLIDTSRHYIAKSVIKDNLDLMEMNKFNVFHWHITDDPSFPYVSIKFPDLSKKGAWHETIAVYTQQDVADIIEYARLRGIRVVSEFDTPGHTQSFEAGQPGLLAECYDESGVKTGGYGPMNPTKKRVYAFIQEFFEEVTQVFPDKYLHLGGDEVDFKCWRSNPEITEFMNKWNLTDDYTKLESIYIKKLLDIVSSFPTKNGYIVWQEVFDNGVQVKDDTIINVWKGQWEWELSRVTKAGYRVILSSPWYLNYISYGSDWTKYYTTEPLDFYGDAEQKSLIVGGEASMWDEFVNSINLTPRLWPRACAVAERLWSPADVRDLGNAKSRIQEMECRMLQRGYPVQPINGPAFCNIDWNA
ncbi:beta-hexosaminidase subunit alpha [Eurytemora carolleeae]|uniref:beta-hexosaminidase subunit alpha n=1 Tax=Eurytemora carolleeae TaxID=1294199 RepID=UPI000C75A489|nr:beta-hexosaminidase subunit alpha [Eurytemora carolleeae]|eukprot:XP_023335137.1 beta-hexosaminidase subunit alpha-like [Eurytemora affinis]